MYNVMIRKFMNVIYTIIYGIPYINHIVINNIVNIVGHMSVGEYSQMIDWLNNNFGLFGWRYGPNTNINRGVYSFIIWREEDAMAFKLMWI